MLVKGGSEHCVRWRAVADVAGGRVPKSADNRAGLLRRYYRTAMMITPAGSRNPEQPDLDAD
jgi:hypothetical protein